MSTTGESAVAEEEVYPAGDMEIEIANPEARYEGPGAPWFSVATPPISDERLSVGARLYFVFLLRAASLKEPSDNETISALMSVNDRAGAKYRDELRKYRYCFQEDGKTILIIERTP